MNNCPLIEVNHYGQTFYASPSCPLRYTLADGRHAANVAREVDEIEKDGREPNPSTSGDNRGPSGPKADPTGGYRASVPIEVEYSDFFVNLKRHQNPHEIRGEQCLKPKVPFP